MSKTLYFWSRHNADFPFGFLKKCLISLVWNDMVLNNSILRIAVVNMHTRKHTHTRKKCKNSCTLTSCLIIVYFCSNFYSSPIFLL